MWDLPGPGLGPVSPALAGGFLTTASPGKSLRALFKKKIVQNSKFKTTDKNKYIFRKRKEITQKNYSVFVELTDITNSKKFRQII